MMMVGMMGIGMLLPVILIGVAIYALVAQQQSNSRGPSPSRQTSIEILKERYARGEISREEYNQVQRDLEGSAS